MSSVETKISGGRMEQCQMNMVGEVKDPKSSCNHVRVAKDTCGLALSCGNTTPFLFASRGLKFLSFSAKFDNCRQYTSELMVWFCGKIS